MIEVERKFVVEADFVLPPLAELPGWPDGWTVADPGVTHMEATYFDTSDLRLARAPMTLRRRTGGKDAGWHLKMQSGKDREEIHAPLGSAKKTVPRKLSDLVLVHSRHEPLRPVAKITTERHVRNVCNADGEVLVELAEDLVQAQTLDADGQDAGRTAGWRELEAELMPAGGDDDLTVLVGLLEAAGAHPAPFPSKLVRALGDAALAPPEVVEPAAVVKPEEPASAAVASYLRAQTRALMAQDPRVRQDLYDSVHKMRVAARRLRSALRTFRPLLDRERADALEPELRWLGTVLGDPRDREVLHDRLRKELDSLPPELMLRPVAAVFHQEMLGGLQQAQGKAREELRSERYLDLVDALVDFAADPPVTEQAEQPAAAVLAGLVAKAWRRLDRAVRAAQASQRDEDWHEARKSGKRARYAAEAVEAVHGGDAADLAAQAEAVQEVLGEHQDSVVARDVLRRLAAAHDDAGFTLGILYGVERERGRAARQAFDGVWAQARRKKHRRWLG
ncbi:MAG: CYTH and CHAD domain-containing protein [Frankiaceae bacterium]